jgi:hypothetical protein
MSDRNLVFKYLNSFYFITYKNSDFILSAFDNSEIKNKTEILVELKLVFKTIKNLSDYYEEWLDKSINLFLKNIDNFLDECYLELGPTNWVVKHKVYGNINYNFLRTQNSFDKKYHEALMYFFEKWYDNKIFEISEKMLESF